MSDLTKRSARGWALVTGASSGLGVEFARQLAARGHDVILTARRRDRLESVAWELAKKYGVQTLVIEADLGAVGAAKRFVQDLDARGIVPEVLVNNAGFGVHGNAIDVALERAEAMIQLNITSLTELTIALGAKMAVRGSGGILNVSSIGAFQATPTFAVYSATKSYVASFSQAIARELAPRGVRVTVLCPGPTQTEFFDASDMKADVPSFLIMSAERCVSIGLRALDRGRGITISGLLNAITAWSARVAPLWLAVRAAGWVMRPVRESRALPSPKR
jgi:short-subunit dehydrogenase